MGTIGRYVRYFALAAALAVVLTVAAALQMPPLWGTLTPVEAGAAFWSEERELVNLNTATLEELCTLPQIGPSRAQAILDYREQHGEFRSVRELCNVHGIGEEILGAVRPWITT